jgi:hypothetical protein
LELLDSCENFLPIYCDSFPTELVSWYSTKSKLLISNLALIKQPDLISSCLPFSKKILDDFFLSAKHSLFELNQLLLKTMDQVVSYLNDSLPAMKASEFLPIVSQVKLLTDINSELKEERKEDNNYDWLFKG